jgi:hypothetical protein
MIPLKKNRVRFEVLCPCCQKKPPVGFLGGGMNRRFFCRECCIEFIIKSQTIRFIIVDTKGNILK